MLTPYPPTLIKFGQKEPSAPDNIPTKILEQKFRYYGQANLTDETENKETGHIFINNEAPEGIIQLKPGTKKYINILLTNQNFDDIGLLKGFISPKRAYINHINNYSNVYNDSGCYIYSPINQYKSPHEFQKHYKKAGYELLKTFENLVRQDKRGITYIESFPVKKGSRLFHIKNGFIYADNPEKYNPCPWDKNEKQFGLFKKIL